MTEIEELKRKCLKDNGQPRKNASHADLIRLLELQATVTKKVDIEDYDNLSELETEYGSLYKSCYDEEGNLKKGWTSKKLARIYALKDMIEQEPPKITRLLTKTLPNGRIEIIVSEGPPTVLEGRDENGVWKTVSRIMSRGEVRVPKERYDAFRLARGTRHPQHIEPPASNPNPNKRKVKK